MSQISAADFKKLYDAKARDWALFDVREKGETVDGHIFGASTLPRRLIEFRIAELVPNDEAGIGGLGRGFVKADAKLQIVETSRIDRPLALVTIGEPQPKVKQVIDAFRTSAR